MSSITFCFKSIQVLDPNLDIHRDQWCGCPTSEEWREKKRCSNQLWRNCLRCLRWYSENRVFSKTILSVATILGTTISKQNTQDDPLYPLFRKKLSKTLKLSMMFSFSCAWKGRPWGPGRPPENLSTKSQREQYLSIQEMMMIYYIYSIHVYTECVYIYIYTYNIYMYTCTCTYNYLFLKTIEKRCDVWSCAINNIYSLNHVWYIIEFGRGHKMGDDSMQNWSLKAGMSAYWNRPKSSLRFTYRDFVQIRSCIIGQEVCWSDRMWDVAFSQKQS